MSRRSRNSPTRNSKQSLTQPCPGLSARWVGCPSPHHPGVPCRTRPRVHRVTRHRYRRPCRYELNRRGTYGVTDWGLQLCNRHIGIHEKSVRIRPALPPRQSGTNQRSRSQRSTACTRCSRSISMATQTPRTSTCSETCSGSNRQRNHSWHQQSKITRASSWRHACRGRRPARRSSSHRNYWPR